MNATYRISDDGSAAILTSPTGVETIMALEDVQRMIEFFGSIRAQMKPAVPIDVANRGTCHPANRLQILHIGTESLPLKNGALLLLRSDSFGWVDFEVSPELCQGLLHWLSAQPEAICPPPGTTLN